jgi:hypothetical protein
MNWREFVASIVSSVAWPIAVVLLLVLFRTAVKDAVRTLLDKASGQIEILGVKANWDALVSQTEANIRGEAVPPVISPRRAEQLEEQPAPISPRMLTDAPMVDLGMEMVAINQDLKRALALKHIDDAPYSTMEALAAAAALEDAIPKNDHEALVGISRLIQMMVHIPADEREDATRKVLALTRELRASIAAAVAILEASKDETAQ